MEVVAIIVVSFIMAVMSEFLAYFYMKDNYLIKKKNNKIIFLLILIVLNIFYIFYGKNVILSYLLLLITLFSIVYLCKKYITQNKILETYCENFITLFCICLYSIFTFLKMYNKSIFLWILEFCLLYFFVMHCMLLIKFNKKMTRRNTRDIKVIFTIAILAYFIIAFVINKNYMQLKVLFLMFLLISVIIILVNKKSEILDSIICAFLVVIYILVANKVYLNNIKINEISRVSQKIKINSNLDELVNYSSNERFVFFEKEDFDKKESLNIYIVKEKNGKNVLEKNDTIKDYEVYDAVDQIYLEEITITSEKINNNLVNKERKIQEEKIYKLYYCK